MSSIVENQMEDQMDKEMEAGFMCSLGFRVSWLGFRD